MEIRIVESNRFGKLTPAKLKAFEKSLGATLPEPYRTHLLEHNGGYVDGARRLGDLHHVHGIHDGPQWARFHDRSQMYGGLVPERLLPIADDPGGNLICIELSGARRGAVCCWDHERAGDPAGSVTPLAPDFGAFLRGLAIKYAIARKRMTVVKEAVAEVGANTPVYAGKTILDLAVERGSLRMVKMLVEAGARISPDALIEAVRNKAINTVGFLLARGVEVNYAVPETGFTALMLAASRDAVDVAKVLLKAGADPNASNRWGKTAADLAHSSKMKKLLGAK
jgi:hypothetical protein